MTLLEDLQCARPCSKCFACSNSLMLTTTLIISISQMMKLRHRMINQGHSQVGPDLLTVCSVCSLQNMRSESLTWGLLFSCLVFFQAPLLTLLVLLPSHHPPPVSPHPHPHWLHRILLIERRILRAGNCGSEDSCTFGLPCIASQVLLIIFLFTYNDIK